MTRRTVESDGDQLTLDLGIVAPAPAAPSRWRTARLWWTLARVVVAAAGAVVLAGAAMSLVPYRSSIAGVGIVVTGSVTPAHRGLTVDSSLGSLQFRDVTALPIGLHVTPRIDVAAVRAATSGGESFTTRARADLEAQIPHLVWHFGVLLVVGMAVGALVGSVLVDGFASLVTARSPRRRSGRRRRLATTGGRVVAVTTVVVVALAATLAASYRSRWYEQYTVTGLLADVAAAPSQLAALDARDSGAADKIRAVLRLQDALTQPPVDRSAPPTAFKVLLISDVHRRNIYPYLQQYIDANDVKLIVNTGDETLIGNTAELTPDYAAAISAITAHTPMLWVKGNHDSPAVAAAMDAIPGVTILDGQIVTALGLQIFGTADPRTYGAAGDAGSDAPAAVTRIETAAASDALAGLNRSTYLDLLMAHEPVEADAIATTLGPSVRAQASATSTTRTPNPTCRPPPATTSDSSRGAPGWAGCSPTPATRWSSPSSRSPPTASTPASSGTNWPTPRCRPTPRPVHSATVRRSSCTTSTGSRRPPTAPARRTPASAIRSAPTRPPCTPSPNGVQPRPARNPSARPSRPRHRPAAATKPVTRT